MSPADPPVGAGTPIEVRAAARASVREVVATGGACGRSGRRWVVPLAAAAAVAAAACTPVAWPLLAGGTLATPALAAAFGQAGAVDGHVLAEVVMRTWGRLRARAGPHVGQSELQEALADELAGALVSSSAEAAGLRAEVAGVLQGVDAVKVALTTTIETTGQESADQVRAAVLIAGLRELGTQFIEFGWLLEEVNDQITRIAETQAEIAAGSRAMLEAQQRTLMQLTILRQQTRPVRVNGGGPGGQPEVTGTSPDQERAAAPEAAGVPVDPECPYPGLAPFGPQDADRFFGRQQLTAVVVTRLAEQLTRPGLLMVLGPPGSGKSSLLRAGLLPAIAAGGLPVRGSQAWPQDLMTPGRRPLLELATRIAALAGIPAGALDADLRTDPARITAAIRQALLAYARRQAQSSWLGLGPAPAVMDMDATGHPVDGATAAADRVAEAGPGRVASSPRLVLIVDQFEEVFTQCTDEQERRAFIRALCAAAGTTAAAPLPGGGGMPGMVSSRDAPAVVVIGMRADFYTRSATYPELVPYLQNCQVLVGPMDEAGVRAAIERPAASAGLVVDAGLVEVLLADLGLHPHPISPLASAEAPGKGAGSGLVRSAGDSYEAGRLPLLAYALEQTWRHREGRRLTVAAYRAIGGIDGVVARAAETLYERFDADGKQAARRLLLRLVSPGEGTADTRRRVTVTELTGATELAGPADTPQVAAAQAVLTDLIQARLLTAGTDADGRDTVEISHEALLTAWPRLREWLNQDRAGQRIRRDLTDAAHAWQAQGREPSQLLGGTRLALAREWAASHGQDLNPDERAFLAACQQRERRATRLRRAVALGLLVGIPAILVAVNVRNPWIIAGTVAAAVIVVFSAAWQQRYRRLALRDEQAFQIQNGCLVLADGQLPVVRDIADPVMLGVHQVPPGNAPERYRTARSGLPAYVPRDVDAVLRERLARGGFVLLVGDSTAGKTRTAFEAVSATLASHSLICPSSRDSIAVAANEAAQSRRCVLWLDDLERYLGVGGLTAAQLGRVLSGEGHHRVIVATMRTAELARLTADISGDDAGRQASREIRRVLDQAYSIRVARMFSSSELESAKARDWDPRIAEAMVHAGVYGIAEFLAAGPQLLRDWEDARDSSAGPHARGAALVAAAIDIRRAGYTSPISRALLDHVHEQYLSDPEHAHAPREPDADAWAWATRQRRSTTALLRPAGPDLVEVFDYLVDTVERRAGPWGRVPESIVHVAIHSANPADADSIAEVAYSQGRYSLAEYAWRWAVQKRESDRLLGPEHPDTLTSRSNLAVVLDSLGRLEEAEAQQRAVLDARMRLLGPEHPDTLTSRSNLAVVLDSLGRLEEAEAQQRAVLDARMRLLGPEHPDTLTSRSNLAVVLDSLGRLEEAEAQQRAVLDARMRLLGPEHPDTLTSRSNLAVVLDSLGRLEEAEAQQRAVLDARMRLLGPDHPDTLTSRSNLASVLRALGRVTEAETEQRAVLETQMRVLGPEHPDTLTSRSNLAVVLDSLGRLEEAEAQQQPVLDARMRLLGPEHPDTLTSRSNLASVLRALGRVTEAETQQRAVLETQMRVLGPDHPDTLTSRSNLASVLRALGRVTEAETEQRAVLETQMRVLGPDHPDTLTSRSNLASVLRALGRVTEAETEQRAVLETQMRVLGPDHPSTLASRNNLAWILLSLGHVKEAPAERLNDLVDIPVNEDTARPRVEISDYRIVAELAHSLRTPLTAARYQADAIALSNSENPELVTQAKRIEGFVDLCDTVLAAFRQLMDTAQRVDRFRGESLPEIIRRLHGAIESKVRNFTILTDLSVPGSVPSYSTSYIATLLLPLIENAIEASPPGGEITVRYTSSTDAIMFTVDNTLSKLPDGPVFPENGRSSKHDGLGLGLTIVRRLADMQRGGQVDTSVSGNVVHVSVRLPKE